MENVCYVCGEEKPDCRHAAGGEVWICHSCGQVMVGTEVMETYHRMQELGIEPWEPLLHNCNPKYPCPQPPCKNPNRLELRKEQITMMS